VVALIAAALWRWAWPSGSLTARGMIVVQWLITAAALASWPMVYGKLVITDVRPRLAAEAGAPPTAQHRVLLRADGDTYYIWSRAEQRLEVRKLRQGESLVLGAREHLLDARERPRDESCAP
jgi:hypothetical protein